MDQFDAIRTFVTVAQQGGFSAASRALGMPVPTVSRKVADLEARLGVRLFMRSTRHVSLTDSGKNYFAACRRILDDMRDADEEVIGEYRAPRGELAITAPIGFGRYFLQPIIHEFFAAYPEININLMLVDRKVDLEKEHIDCAIRIAQLPDSSLVAKPLGTIEMMVAASPAYLAKRGTPVHPAELTNHDCVSWASLGPFRAWEFQIPNGKTSKIEMMPIHVRLTTTTPDSAVFAAVEGIGLVQATSYQLKAHLESGALLPVLREFESASTPVTFIYPSQRIVPLKLRAFLDFATPRLTTRLAEIQQYVAGMESALPGKVAKPGVRKK